MNSYVTFILGALGGSLCTFLAFRKPKNLENLSAKILLLQYALEIILHPEYAVPSIDKKAYLITKAFFVHDYSRALDLRVLNPDTHSKLQEKHAAYFIIADGPFLKAVSEAKTVEELLLISDEYNIDKKLWMSNNEV